MISITRRAALGGFAALPAAAAPAIAGNTPAEVEHIGERIARLSRELGAALDQVNADALTNRGDFDQVQIWIAEVWPTSVNEHPFLAPRDIPAALARFAAVRS